MVEMVTMWQTADGVLMKSKEDALAHEREIEVEQRLSRLVDRSDGGRFAPWETAQIVKMIIDNAGEVQKALAYLEFG